MLLPPPLGRGRRVVRDRLAVPRFAVLRGFAAPVKRLAAARLGAAELRDLFADGLAAAERDFAAPAGFARVVFPALVLRPPEDRRAAPVEPDVELEPLLALALPSIDHLPDITRCAASATASAMIEPSFVALDMTLVAACDAVSAASSPASRILRRAAGLALIAAAAAAGPAASISLLIAALASLSTVLLRDAEEERADPEDDRPDDDLELELEEDFLGDFAIAFTPSVAWERHFSAVTVPE